MIGKPIKSIKLIIYVILIGINDWMAGASLERSRRTGGHRAL